MRSTWRWTERFPTQRAVAVVGLVLLYAASGPRTLPDADAGEFAAVAMAGGIPHPPGYPVLVLLLEAFGRLSPLLGVVAALTASAVLCAAAALLLLAWALQRRGARPLEATLAASVVFLTCNVWHDCITFEPFALNLLLAAGVLAGCARLAAAQPEQPQRGICVAIGVLFGLGAGNHHSLAMLLPLPLAVVVARNDKLRDARGLAAGLLLGMLPLLSLLGLRTQRGWVWGDWSHFWPEFVSHLLRQRYGTFTLVTDTRGIVGYGALRFLATLPRVFSYALFALAIAGAMSSYRRARAAGIASLRDGYAVGAVASWFAAGIGLPALFKLAGTSLDDLIADRFLALPALLLAFPLAEGFGMLRRHARLAYAPICAALLSLHVALQWPFAERASHRFFEMHIRNIVATVNGYGVVMTRGDQGFAAGLYLRHVLGDTGVVMVAASINERWYGRYIARQLESKPAGATGRRPLYVLDPSERERGLRAYPLGPLLRILEDHEPTPSAPAALQLNETLFARLELPRGEQLCRLDAWEHDELRSYARTFRILERRLTGAAETALAARARRDGDALSAAANCGAASD